MPIPTANPSPPMDLTYAPGWTGNAASKQAGDRYFWAIGIVLLGYALLSRSFAYLGVPPVFIGEIMLGLGMIQLIRAGVWRRLGSMPSLWLYGLFFVLAIARTVPYLGLYAIDAGRDFMQVGYGLYAFILAGLIVERPERLRQLIVRYRTMVGVMLALILIVYFVGKVAGESVPKLPWADNVRIVEAKGGDIMVHLAGITVFLMVGLMRARPALTFALAASAGLIMVSNRGGMVAYFLALGVGLMMRPPGTGRMGKLAYAFALFLVIGLIIGPVVSIHGGTRDISVEQIWTNIQSVFGKSESGSLEGTKKWRTDWWEQIYDYTVRGEYFWEGKGFGVNLAKDDGFLVDPALRSPHNGHMTILARMGVPGASIWVLLQIVWGLTMLRAWWNARERHRGTWMAVFAVLVSYWLAMHINAAFDVYFEGPMGGIWFYSVFGLGLGAAWIHRTRPEILDSLDADAPPRPASRTNRPSWGWPSASRPAGSQPVSAAGWGRSGVRERGPAPRS